MGLALVGFGGSDMTWSALNEASGTRKRCQIVDKFVYENRKRSNPMIKPTGFLSIWLLLLALVGCATLPENVDRQPSEAFTDTGDTTIGSAIAEATSDHPGQSGFLLLENGLDAFVSRAVLARFAERSIDVQYYLYHDDLVGRLFTDQLVQAADRGVRVRLLVDDMDLSGRDLG
jgi:putative cardiolipin synthase